MISLELTSEASVDQTKLFLAKGRRVAVCQACQHTYSRSLLQRCGDCKHDFCKGCVDACRCHAKTFRINLNFWKRRSEPVAVPKLALVR